MKSTESSASSTSALRYSAIMAARSLARKARSNSSSTPSAKNRSLTVMAASSSDDGLSIGRARQVEEHVLQIRLLGRHVDDPIPIALHRGEHLPGIRLVFAIGDFEHTFALQLDFLEARGLGRRNDVAIAG